METITTTYQGGALFETSIGRHTLQTDVPESMGGKDRALQPPQLFIASIGTCVGAMVADYARRHDLDPSGMTVDVSFEKAAQPTRLTNIAVRVHLPNARIGDERIRSILKRVAEHCPVHETMETLEDVQFDVVSG